MLEVIKFEIIYVFAGLINQRLVSEISIYLKYSSRFRCQILALHREMRWASDTPKKYVKVSTSFMCPLNRFTGLDPSKKSFMFLRAISNPWVYGKWKREPLKNTLVTAAAFKSLIWFPVPDKTAWYWMLGRLCCTWPPEFGVLEFGFGIKG